LLELALYCIQCVLVLAFVHRIVQDEHKLLNLILGVVVHPAAILHRQIFRSAHRFDHAERVAVFDAEEEDEAKRLASQFEWRVREANALVELLLPHREPRSLLLLCLRTRNPDFAQQGLLNLTRLNE